uniref:DNA-directed RNA polymerase III subunit RPC8 n=1 Tax=Caligus rogercresseyi TaxID=217165 RepID=C1BRA1_CALRO|nr:DNA-directed RNA polymerase III subunit RPC8 [Caligus rogercresseyi]
MFVLSECKSLIRLPALHLGRNLPEALSEEINRKLSNRVVHNVGLAVCLFDILEIGESFLFPGDGASHTRVNFRILVFRPFMEEVINGKIKSCSKDGVQVSLGFFEDIWIPPEALQHPYRFDEADQVWVWEYPTEDGEKHDLFMDPGEEIRFRVTAETFSDTSPNVDPNAEGQSGESNDKIPYTISASVNEPGLGLHSWWNSPS